MGCCCSETESLWYGNWNRPACRKGKCEVDRPYRLTGVNPSRKQKWFSPSCLWSHAQGINLPEIFLQVWVINGQYVIDESICEVELRCKPFPTGREQDLYEFRLVWLQKYVGYIKYHFIRMVCARKWYQHPGLLFLSLKVPNETYYYFV